MTFWAPGEVRKFVLAAGWNGREAEKAVAVAMATSQGADHWQWASESTPDVDQRGLFGLDVRHWDGQALPDLHNPQTNANLASWLWTQNGRNWDWHPVVRVNGGDYVRSVLSYLLADNGFSDSNKSAYNRVVGLEHSQHVNDRLKDLLSRMSPAPISGGVW